MLGQLKPLVRPLLQGIKQLGISPFGSPVLSPKREEREKWDAEEDGRASPMRCPAEDGAHQAGAGRDMRKAVHEQVEAEAEEHTASSPSPRHRRRDLHRRGLHGFAYTVASW
jgi:hypothetical protein